MFQCEYAPSQQILTDGDLGAYIVYLWAAWADCYTQLQVVGKAVRS